MMYTLNIKCIEGHYYDGNTCSRIIEMSAHDSLDDLHEIIQKAVNFGNDHPYTFYGGRYPRHRKIRFGENEYGEHDSRLFWKIPLNDVYPLPSGFKLYYVFDFGDHWLFEIRKSRKKTEFMSGVSYPRIIEKIGLNPTQYPSFEE
jgi:hypothetical protein